MKVIIQKSSRLISGFLEDEEKVNSDIFFSLPFFPESNKKEADRIVGSEGNSFLVDDSHQAKQLYYKDQQLFFIYEEDEKRLKQIWLPQSFFEEKRNARTVQEIDILTRDKIKEGFEFDGYRFSLSQNAQLNWQGLMLLHQSGMFGESQEISTKNDETYILTKENLLPFIGAGKTKLTECLDFGRKKKMNIKKKTS